MIEKQFFFLAGFPRSGSTVLSSILNQNPNIYVTPTSPLFELVRYNIVRWANSIPTLANPVEEQKRNLAKALMNGCWEHVPQKIIIDKGRSWIEGISFLKDVITENPKIILTVRDIPSILASFLKIHKETNEHTQKNKLDEMILKNNFVLNDSSRIDIIWQKFVKPVYDEYQKKYYENKEHFLLIEYDDLTNQKEKTINEIYNFLEIEKYGHHQFENIVNVTEEDDLSVWKLKDLHKIKPKLEKSSTDPREILGESIYEKYVSMNLEFWRN